MKTTVEVPDVLFRKAKASAASKGLTLKEFLTEALEARLASLGEPGGAKPWMNVFAGLKRGAAFHVETARIEAAIEEEFERIEPEAIWGNRGTEPPIYRALCSRFPLESLESRSGS
ncbi:MAG: hypothetical protein ABSE73_08780 [Planctomycetota bacterium]